MTTITTDFFNLTEDTYGSIFYAWFARRESPGETPPPILQLRRGRAEAPAWYMVQAWEFDPEPLTVEKLLRRAIYTHPDLSKALLEIIASEGWFDRRGEEYFLTEAGQEQLQSFKERGKTVSDIVSPLLTVDVDRLETLARQTIEASLESPDPPGTWSLRYSRNRGADDTAPPLARLMSYFADYNAFRDDCHMASYAPHQIEGFAWEAFSHIWDSTATSVEALFTTLSYRGYAREDYDRALKDLEKRGWIEPDGEGDTFQLTNEGNSIREEAEDKTNHYYYTPWEKALTPEEINEYETLLHELQSECNSIADR